MNGLTKGILVFGLLLLGGGVYLGISSYMQMEYQLSVKASHGIGLLSAGIYYFGCILTVVLSKAVPSMYLKHGETEEDDLKEVANEKNTDHSTDTDKHE